MNYASKGNKQAKKSGPAKAKPINKQPRKTGPVKAKKANKQPVPPALQARLKAAKKK
jgi:hypothetical protein